MVGGELSILLLCHFEILLSMLFNLFNSSSMYFSLPTYSHNLYIVITKKNKQTISYILSNLPIILILPALPYSYDTYFSNSKKIKILPSFFISHSSQSHAPVFYSILFEPRLPVLSLQPLYVKTFNSLKLYYNTILQNKQKLDQTVTFPTSTSKLLYTTGVRISKQCVCDNLKKRMHNWN